MTARTRWAFCSTPSRSTFAMGTILIIMAKAVIKTGRKRVNPASRPALRESLPSVIFSLASGTNDFVVVAGHATQIASGDRAKYVNHRRNVVIRNHSDSRSPLSRYKTGHDRWRCARVGAGDGNVL